MENWVFLRDTKCTHYSFTRLSIEHTVSSRSTIQSEISSGERVWSLKLAWFNTVAGSFAMALCRVFFGLEKTIDTASIARIKRSGWRAGSIQDMGRK